MKRRVCHICGSKVATTAKDNLYAHKRALGTGKTFLTERCPASGQKAQPVWWLD